MCNENEEMALFSEATPHIQKYHGKTLVIKYGGNAMVNDELKLAVMNDLVTLTLLGVRVVLVHGGGPAINKMLPAWARSPACGRPTEATPMMRRPWASYSRCWRARLTGDLVALLKGRGVGLCGMDGHTITCSRKSDVDSGYVGEIEKGGYHADRAPAGRQFIPVIAIVGTTTASPQHQRRHGWRRRLPLPCMPKQTRQHDGYCRSAL